MDDEMSQSGEGKKRRTPEEKATRRAEREERLAAMSPEDRAAKEAKRAQRRADRGKA